MLYLISTPIGNLEDISIRAIQTLRNVDLILAEDTRHTRKLFAHHHIEKPIQSFHQHNEHRILASVLEKLKNGVNIALVSDAGTPGISDPGFLLVRACHESNLPVSALPGATAFVPALVVSGIPCDRFHFEGFLPHKKGRNKRWEYLSNLPTSFILYESPYRLVKCVQEIVEHCGEERRVCLAREISKIHEEIKQCSALELLKELKARTKIKGEIVLIVAGKQ